MSTLKSPTDRVTDSKRVPLQTIIKNEKKSDLFVIGKCCFSHIVVYMYVWVCVFTPNFAFLFPVQNFDVWQARVFHKHCISGQMEQKRQLGGTVVAWHIKFSFNLQLSILHLKKNANVYSCIERCNG